MDLELVHSVLLTLLYAKRTRNDRPTITEQIYLNLSIDFSYYPVVSREKERLNKTSFKRGV